MRREEATDDELVARYSTTGMASSFFTGTLFLYPTLVIGIGPSIVIDAAMVLILFLLGIVGVFSWGAFAVSHLRGDRPGRVETDRAGSSAQGDDREEPIMDALPAERAA